MGSTPMDMMGGMAGMGMMGGMGGMGMPGGLGMPAAATGGLGATQVICLANMLSIEELASDEYDEVATNHLVCCLYLCCLRVCCVSIYDVFSLLSLSLLSSSMLCFLSFYLYLCCLCRLFLIFVTSVRRLEQSRNCSSPDQLRMVQLCLGSAKHLSSSQMHCQLKRCLHTYYLHYCSYLCLALQATTSLTGRTFDGQKVACTYISDEVFAARSF